MKKACAFYNLLQNFGTGLLARDCPYKKKIAYPRLSLSPPLEERVRGEVKGSWALIGSNHLTAIFSQHILYPAGVRIDTSSQKMVSIERYLF